MTVDNILTTYNFHDSTINLIRYDELNHFIEFDIEMEPNDFTDNLGHFLIRYCNISNFKSVPKIESIDWENTSITVLTYDCQSVELGLEVRYFIEFLYYITKKKEYLDINFCCSDLNVRSV